MRDITWERLLVKLKDPLVVSNSNRFVRTMRANIDAYTDKEMSTYNYNDTQNNTK